MENEPPFNPAEYTNRNEASESDWANLIAKSQVLLERVNAVASNRSSYSHITRNLMLAAEPSILSALKGDQVIYDQAVENLDLLERYFEIIDNNPEVAEREKNERQGMFPEIYQSGIIDSNKVVVEIENKLKGESHD
jgi:hypothetical protein